jgi:NADH-quinone oxidoreductase subunit A
VAVFVSFVYLIGNGALDWGPAKRLVPMRDGARFAGRTTESTVRRVGTTGRGEAA